MSGGVDSTVAAALLKDAGHEVVGVTLKLLKRGATGFGCCGSPDDVMVAKRSAEKIGIPHYVLDYAVDFEKDVIHYFVDSYLNGETPNPCLACNRTIKFDRLRKFADSLDASLLATGHYARIERQDRSGDGRYRLLEAVDSGKDQSYVLYHADQESLATTLFPVGSRPKSEIRELARQFSLPNAEKKESQEICFVPNKDYPSFIRSELKIRNGNDSPTAQRGPIKDATGALLGEHKGVAFYTVGQRKGLGLTTSEPYYVTRLDAATNTVIVGPDPQARKAGLVASDAHWVAGAPPDTRFETLVKIRYKHEPAPAVVTIEGDRFHVRFSEAQRAVSPGQAAVLYRWDWAVGAREVIGGGKIVSAESA